MDWDSENFEPSSVPAPSIANKWDGEDEEEDVKESWEDDEEEKKREEQEKKKTVSAQSKKPKSKLLEKIGERERREQEMKKGKNIVDIEPEYQEITADAIRAEKLRKQKLQEDADLEVAREMLGVVDDVSVNNVSVDKLNPKTKEDFTLFQEALLKKILDYKNSEHFATFSENLIRDICANFSSNGLKKLKLTIDEMFNEKLKLEKTKKSSKSKGKAKLVVDNNNLYDEYSAYTVDDYDDFM